MQTAQTPVKEHAVAHAAQNGGPRDGNAGDGNLQRIDRKALLAERGDDEHRARRAHKAVLGEEVAVVFGGGAQAFDFVLGTGRNLFQPGRGGSQRHRGDQRADKLRVPADAQGKGRGDGADDKVEGNRCV